jgi:hypothetical protein
MKDTWAKVYDYDSEQEVGTLDSLALGWNVLM